MFFPDSDSQSDATNSSGEETTAKMSLSTKTLNRCDAEKASPATIYATPKHFSKPLQVHFVLKKLWPMSLFLLSTHKQCICIRSSYTQQHCYVSQLTLDPGMIRTRVFSFLRRMRCSRAGGIL
jgi:hypothetical protein